MNRAALLVVVAACGGGARPVPAGERVGPALASALGAATAQQAPWRCAAPDGPVLADETIAGWKASGHTLTAPGTGDVTIAAIADAGGAAPATIAALGRLKPKLASADVVLALGGMGTTRVELEATLGAIADKATHPIIALPGDLESAGSLAQAIAALRAKGMPVIDGRLAQRIALPGATIALIAGASAPGRLAAGGDGCAYRTEDVPAALADLTKAGGLRILASAESPRITVGGEPAGELALTPGAGAEVDVVLHGPAATGTAATKARSGGRDAEAAALTPGTADATPRLPGGTHVPAAGILTVHGTTWSWKPIADVQ